ncbi:MAG: LysR family transcriptional regulator [Gammaproteobacteria bacterium]|nr:LysR family transcriptional regulator [Gammaproteobacteria bacterium]MDP2141690.1 LysR family transcriptional regulator [Gammaproteobacteria bacterium]MDP2347925.1 LysR family transcriptional regulator [Gammaproteobacteria bacterium]
MISTHLETQEIRVFKTVCDTGGFKTAADKLYVTQSAVSQAIANLERKLGTLLIERGKPIALTESGQRLQQYADLVLQEEHDVLTDIADIRQGVASTLQIAMSGSVSQLFGNELLEDYCDSNPLTRLKVDVMPSRKIIQGVMADTLELGFGPFQHQMPALLETVPLFRESRKLVINRSHPRLGRLLEDPENCIQEIPLMVSHLEDPDVRPAIEKLRNEFGTIWEISNLSLRLNMVSKNIGMCYVDERVLKANTLCADFVPLTGLAFSDVELTFGLYYRKRRTLSTGARQFIDICQSFSFDNRGET